MSAPDSKAKFGRSARWRPA